MVFSRRFLRVAALGAVFALGLAGTALAAPAWVTVKGPAIWTDTGITAEAGGAVVGEGDDTNPTNATTVVIESGTLTADTTDGALAAEKLDMAGGKLIVKGTANELTIAASAGVGEIRVSKKGSVIQLERDNAAAIKILQGAANAPVVLSDDADLTIEKTSANGGITGIGAALEIKGKGTLTLKAPVATVNALKIEGGATLVVDVDSALPGFTGTPTITNGNIVINGESFGGNATKLTMTKGDLTLNKAMVADIATVEIQNGTLTVAEGAKIGNGLNGELVLGTATTAGHLTINGDMILDKLTTQAGDNTINTNGHILNVKSPTNSFTLNAKVDGGGTLFLAHTADLTVTLKKEVAGTVEASAANSQPLKLKAEDHVSAVKFTANSGATTSATLELAANKDIGTLSFEKASDFVAELAGNNTIEKLNLNAPVPLKVKSSSGGNTIGFLAPVDGAKLEMDTTGQALLSIKNGAAGLSEVKLQTGTKLALGDKALLQKTTSMALGSGSELTLPSGEFPDLKLHATANGAAISVDVAAQDPVLKVKEIEVGNTQTLTVNRPDTWCLTLSGDVTLLTAPTVTLTGSGTMKGAPESDDVALIKLNTTKTALILTPRAGLKFPVLKGTPTSSGNQCNVLVKVVDGKVDAASWEWELNVLPLGSATHSILAAGTTESVLYGVQLADNFQSGFLRVRAKKAGSTVCGVVDVPLKRGAVGGTPDSGKVGADLKKPESWSRTAISGDSVVLTSKLKLDGTPKSLKVKASGMKNEPKAELLDAAGKVVAKSSVPSVSAVKDYTLKLTCKTTKAEIDKGAKIEQVTVTMSDGKTHTIPVNVKLSDMKIGTPDTKKPGGDNGGGKTPGGDNGGGKNPGGEDGGGKNPGGEDGGKKGSSGGGCDAGFGGVALALGAAFLLKRKA